VEGFLTRFGILALACAFAVGCATYRPPADYPQDFRARAETQTEGGVRVSAALLSEDEAKQIFATSVIAKDIQPIWIEIDNQDDDEYALMHIAELFRLGLASGTAQTAPVLTLPVGGR